MPGWPGSPARSPPRQGERRHPDGYRARRRQERRSARRNGIVKDVVDSTPGEGTSNDSNEDPRINGLLSAAVSGIGGTERPGQTLMAHSVWAAMESGEHLAVQAGTGTGKSL